MDDLDWQRFQKTLFFANNTHSFTFRSCGDQPLTEFSREEITAIGAYCLMPNHFHILMKETVEGGMSRFMEKLTTSYAKYFNEKYKRVGGLFQGTFKAEHLNRDEYLKYIFAYIHLNPIKIIDPNWKENGIQQLDKAKKYLNTYTYSSYLDYLGSKREESLILDRSAFPDYFSSELSFSEYLHDWLDYAEIAKIA